MGSDTSNVYFCSIVHISVIIILRLCQFWIFHFFACHHQLHRHHMVVSILNISLLCSCKWVKSDTRNVYFSLTVHISVMVIVILLIVTQLYQNLKFHFCAVLFDALQIPAGMLEFCWIPLDSTGMEPASTRIGLDSSGFCWTPVESSRIQAFLQEWHWNSDFFSLNKVIF